MFDPMFPHLPKEPRIACACQARREAEQFGCLVYDATLDGWVFPDLPKRKTRRPWLVADHTGEPYTWTHDCPFCGRLLR